MVRRRDEICSQRDQPRMRDTRRRSVKRRRNSSEIRKENHSPTEPRVSMVEKRILYNIIVVDRLKMFLDARRRPQSQPSPFKKQPFVPIPPESPRTMRNREAKDTARTQRKINKRSFRFVFLSFLHIHSFLCYFRLSWRLVSVMVYIPGSPRGRRGWAEMLELPIRELLGVAPR